MILTPHKQIYTHICTQPRTKIRTYIHTHSHRCDSWAFKRCTARWWHSRPVGLARLSQCRRSRRPAILRCLRWSIWPEWGNDSLPNMPKHSPSPNLLAGRRVWQLHYARGLARTVAGSRQHRTVGSTWDYIFTEKHQLTSIGICTSTHSFFCRTGIRQRREKLGIDDLR